jgi:tetratricopeptide (TPR) repeat protein
MASLHGQPARAEGFFKEAMAISAQRAALTGISTSVRRVYGAALAREGRAAEAVQLLEAVLAETKKHLRDEANLRRTQGWLGDAYDLAGRTAEARPLLQAARDEWLRYGVQTETQTLGARARWARFLYDHGEAAPAQAEFESMLQVVHGAASAPAALAQAGLARIALDRGDLAVADTNSAAAVRTLDAVTMEYDVRYRCDVWLTRAEVLHRMGRGAEARVLAQRALDAAMVYDFPGSWRIARGARDVAEMKK